ncbi:STAS domain-containing protein [Streptomyces sp. DH24]|nr:STAS domain-containing protein [Streptomyces sp. DH24]MDG9719779.1 STAS domain-containing protein [Streptomyces sp. DH24]
MSAVPFCDSAGLSVLLRTWRQADQAGPVPALASVPTQLQRMLAITGVDTVLRALDTVAEAESGMAVGDGA